MPVKLSHSIIKTQRKASALMMGDEASRCIFMYMLPIEKG
jgi:hypothetical protein